VISKSRTPFEKWRTPRTELSDLEYEDRRAALNLPSLSYRMHRADMLMICNILHENVGLYPPMFFHQQLSSVTRGHSIKLFKPHAQKTVRCNFFLLDQLMLGTNCQIK